MKKIIVIVSLWCACTAQIFSQSFNTIGASMSIGPTVFFGDISSSMAKSMKYMTEFGVRTNVYESALFGKLAFSQGVLGGSKDVGQTTVKFDNAFYALSVSLLFEPLKLVGNKADSKFQPYITVGYGGMWFRAKYFDDNSGAMLASFGYKKAQPIERTCEWFIPHGIGFEYQCTPQVALSMACNRWYVHSDKLDAMIGDKNDVIGSIAIGAVLTFGEGSPTTKKQPSYAEHDDDDYDSDEVVHKQAKVKEPKTKPAKTAQPAAPVVVNNCDEYKSQIAKKDSEIQTLRDSIQKLMNIPESLKIKYCRKYLNGLLYRKCDVDVIKSNLAIIDSAKINDENIDKYKYLLRNYPNWYSEFLTVVEFAQKDGRRYSPLTSESSAFRTEVINRVQNLGYSKRSTKNWQIYYLEDQIELLKRRLDEKVKHPEVIIDFSDMLK
ncbi:MAG: hypothetical protein II926_01875 [Bacteroidales bacterium]|nr:hypothetical protein [Bacteroidales bacterium]